MPRPSNRFGASLAALHERQRTQAEARRDNAVRMGVIEPPELLIRESHYNYDISFDTFWPRGWSSTDLEVERAALMARLNAAYTPPRFINSNFAYRGTTSTNRPTLTSRTRLSSALQSTAESLYHNFFFHNQSVNTSEPEMPRPQINYSCEAERPSIYIRDDLHLSPLEPAAAYVYTPNIAGHDPVGWAQKDGDGRRLRNKVTGKLFEHVVTLDYNSDSRDQYYNLLDGIWPWYAALRREHALHPIIQKLMHGTSHHKFSIDWRLIINEYPHQPKGDAPTDGTPMVAYTENVTKGEAGRVTVTKLGKYLRRVYPTLPDNELRDLVMLCSAPAIHHTTDMEKMLEVITSGPSSCMSGGGYDTHPYNVYDPQYGWGMAYGLKGGKHVSRAITYKDPEDEDSPKVYVRSYNNTESNGYTNSSESLDAWLKANGYSNVNAWPEGAKIAKLYYGDDVVAPYIDGRVHFLQDHDDYLTLCYENDADYCARNTGGTATVMPTYNCICCNESIRRVFRYAGPDEADPVCENCGDEYVYAIGRNGYSYYVHSDEVTTTENGQDVVTEYLEARDYREVDGGWYHMDDLTLLANDEYTPDDDLDWGEGSTDSTYVRLGHRAGNGSRWALRTDCWQCEVSGGYYYAEEVDPVTSMVGGVPVPHHEDYPPDNIDPEPEPVVKDTATIDMFEED